MGESNGNETNQGKTKNRQKNSDRFLELRPNYLSAAKLVTFYNRAGNVLLCSAG